MQHATTLDEVLTLRSENAKLRAGKNTLTVWTCATYGDGMDLEVVIGRGFEEVAEPCRVALREMNWDKRHGTPIDTPEQLADARGETFDGICLIQAHEV